MLRTLFAFACTFALLAGSLSVPIGPVELVQEREYDSHDRLTTEVGIIVGTGLSFERHYALAQAEDFAKEDKQERKYQQKQEKRDEKDEREEERDREKEQRKRDRKNQTGSGNETEDPEDPVDPVPLTDCISEAFTPAKWHWAQPYHAKAQLFPEVFQTAGSTWQSETGQSILGTVTLGFDSSAGVQDFSNQIEFTLMDASIIAVTTTWFYTGSGIAVESDSAYNLNYQWTTIENPVGMDLQSIATHELGHTFGLNHPDGEGIECLTMYAISSPGNVQKRTLGDGDIVGVRSIYGA